MHLVIKFHETDLFLVSKYVTKICFYSIYLE